MPFAWAERQDSDKKMLIWLCENAFQKYEEKCFVNGFDLQQLSQALYWVFMDTLRDTFDSIWAYLPGKCGAGNSMIPQVL